MQIVVAQELPQCTMERIRTRAGDDVRGRSQRVSELGVRAVRDDAELADGVDRRLEDESTIDAVDVVRAVDEKVVGFGSLAIDRISLSIAERSARFGYPRRQGNDPRLQQAKLREVASVQRQILQFALLYDLAHAGDGWLNQIGIGAHQHLLLFRSNREMCRDRSRL